MRKSRHLLRNFPTTSSAYQGSLGGSLDAFLTAFNPAGSGLLYSTYLGGGGNDVGYAVAVNAGFNVYFTGNTASSNFPLAFAYPVQNTLSGTQDAFVALFVFGADLRVSQTAPATTTLSTPFTYHMTVTNNGPADASGIVVTDTLPVGASINSIYSTQFSCSVPSGGSTMCTLASLASGASATISLKPKSLSGVAGLTSASPRSLKSTR